jgi:hypothetical protein
MRKREGETYEARKTRIYKVSDYALSDYRNSLGFGALQFPND